MAIFYDRQQPRLHIGASQGVKSTKCAQDRLLYHVIRVAGRAGQRSCESVRGIQMRQDQRLEAMAPVIHGADCTLYSRRPISLDSNDKTLGAASLFPQSVMARNNSRSAGGQLGGFTIKLVNPVYGRAPGHI